MEPQALEKVPKRRPPARPASPSPVPPGSPEAGGLVNSVVPCVALIEVLYPDDLGKKGVRQCLSDTGFLYDKSGYLMTSKNPGPEGPDLVIPRGDSVSWNSNGSWSDGVLE